MKQLLSKLNQISTTWKLIMSLVVIAVIIGKGAIAGKDAVDEYKQLVVNMAKYANQPKLLERWLFLHNEDSLAVSQWVMYQRKEPRDSTGAPVLGIYFLDPKYLPERGVLKAFVVPDSAQTMQVLWNYRKEKD